MRVLVAAASRHHGTREIAEAIATGLIRRGLEAEAVPVEQVTNLSGYDAVVLGSAMYTGRWLGTARRFVQVHASALMHDAGVALQLRPSRTGRSPNCHLGRPPMFKC